MLLNNKGSSDAPRVLIRMLQIGCPVGTQHIDTLKRYLSDHKANEKSTAVMTLFYFSTVCITDEAHRGYIMQQAEEILQSQDHSYALMGSAIIGLAIRRGLHVEENIVAQAKAITPTVEGGRWARSYCIKR